MTSKEFQLCHSGIPIKVETVSKSLSSLVFFHLQGLGYNGGIFIGIKFWDCPGLYSKTAARSDSTAKNDSMGFFSRHVVWDSMGLQLCQHRFWTGALKGVLTGLSVVPQSLDPDKTSKFIPQSHPWAITCSLHCQVVAVCSITVVLRQQMPYTRLKRWFRDDFCSPHSCLEPFMRK